MAKKKPEPIRVEASINIRGIEYDIDQMKPEQRSFLAAVLKVKYLNAMFSGQVHFSADELPPIAEIFPEAAE